MSSENIHFFYRLIILTILITGNINLSFSQTFISNGNVSGNWSKANSPYIIQGDIEIPSNQTLTIEAGTTVLFDGYFGLTVYGKLLSIGTSLDTIKYTSRDTLGVNNSDSIGRWKGILITANSSQDSTILDFSSVQYTFSEMDTSDRIDSHIWITTKFIGALTIGQTNKVRISNSLFTNNLGDETHYDPISVGAITVLHCSPKIISNHIFYNSVSSGISLVNCNNVLIKNNEISFHTIGRGAGIYLFYTLGTLIENNYIHHNNATLQNGGGIYIAGQDYSTIINNTISYNQSENGGAGVCYYWGALGGKLLNNIIANNFTRSGFCGPTDGGAGVRISAVNNKGLFVQNNIIVNNHSAFHGGGLCLNQSNVTICNNIISNNTTYLGGSGGVKLRNDSSSFYNNIIANNYSTFNPSLPRDIDFSNGTDHTKWRNNLWTNDSSNIWRSNVTTPFDTLYCIGADPQFISPSTGPGVQFDGASGNWNSLATSPVIENGSSDTLGLNLVLTDIEGNNRIQGNVIDIGAYESSIISLIPQVISKKKINIFPNPTNGKFELSLPQQSSSTVMRIKIFDLRGSEIFSSVSNYQKNFYLNLSEYPPGFYTINIQFINSKENISSIIQKI